jgi:hypothetical protein
MAAPTLTCKQCNHVNEGERIYCHNCGVKLDRSLLPQAPSEDKNAQKRARKRVLKMTNPSRRTVERTIKSFIMAVISAAIFAAIIQMMRTPEGMPPVNSELLDAPPVGLVLEDAVQSPQAQSVVVTDENVNAYLKATIRSKSVGMLGGNIKFVRLLVNFDPGVCRMNLHQTLFDYPIYAGADYALAINGNRLVAKNVGGRVGRLPVHPLIAQYAGVVFENVWKALKREHQLMNSLQSITIHDGRIQMITRPATQAP